MQIFIIFGSVWAAVHSVCNVCACALHCLAFSVHPLSWPSSVRSLCLVWLLSSFEHFFASFCWSFADWLGCICVMWRWCQRGVLCGVFVVWVKCWWDDIDVESSTSVTHFSLLLAHCLVVLRRFTLVVHDRLNQCFENLRSMQEPVCHLSSDSYLVTAINSSICSLSWIFNCH